MASTLELKKKIFVIDDDPVMRLSCYKILDKDGFYVETYEDGEQGLARIKIEKPDILVVDLKMPKIGGLEVIARVHKIDPEICIIVITGYATIGTAVEAMKTGAYDFLPKPFTPDELRLIVTRGLERSELTKQSRRLKQDKENLERRFITFVSHQLQSPLVAVQQYLDIIQHLGDCENRQQLQDEWIKRSIARIKELLLIVRDWLTISKIESGQFIDNKSSVFLSNILNELMKSYEPMAMKKNIRFISEISDNLSSIYSHERCLKMLFSNLIVNAIKYNKPSGYIKVTTSENTEEVIIKVEDNGIGIAKDKIEFIFEEFYRIKDEQTRNIPGTGLGLPICKKIAKESGGGITAESELQKGTVFTVKLPKFESNSV